MELVQNMNYNGIWHSFDGGIYTQPLYRIGDYLAWQVQYKKERNLEETTAKKHSHPAEILHFEKYYYFFKSITIAHNLFNRYIGN